MTDRSRLDREQIESALAEALAAFRASAELQPVAALAVLRQVQADCESIHRSLERQMILLEASAPELTRDERPEDRALRPRTRHRTGAP